METTDAPARRYGGLDAQARRSQRRGRLVRAAVELVGEDGVGGLTVAAACARAGVSKRYFYDDFASTDELVGAALRSLFDGVAAAIDSPDAPGEGDDGEPVDAARALVDRVVRAALDALDEPGAARLYLEGGSTTAGLVEKSRANQVFVDQLLARVAGGRSADPRAQLTGHLVVSGVIHVVTMWLEGDLDLGRDDLIKELTDVGTITAERIASL